MLLYCLQQDHRVALELLWGKLQATPIYVNCIQDYTIYCTAELITWYIMKQLILPPDVNEVTMQKEIFTPPKIPPSTLDQSSKWLGGMQHQLNLCIKTNQSVHPRTLVAFVIETLSAVIQYHRTIGKAKHQLRDSDITLDRVYTMISEFLIELRLNEEQEKIMQIVTGSNST